MPPPQQVRMDHTIREPTSEEVCCTRIAFVAQSLCLVAPLHRHLHRVYTHKPHCVEIYGPPAFALGIDEVDRQLRIFYLWQSVTHHLLLGEVVAIAVVGGHQNALSLLILEDIL